LKIFIIKAVCVFTVLTLLSCGGNGPQGSEERENAGLEPGIAEDAAAEKILPELPDRDFGGYGFEYFIWDVSEWGGNEAQYHRDVYSEGETGEIINDEVFRRNVKIEERYNITFSQSFAVVSQYESQVRRAVGAGAADFDVLLYQMASMGNLAGNGYLRNVYDLQYTDFTKPWWEKNSIKDLSIANKLFGVNSAITLVDKMGAQALVFNKDILRDYSLGDPYKMVIDGTWTIDSFGKMAKEVSQDLNGDGKMGLEDLFGLFFIRDSMSSFSNGCDAFIAKKDGSDHVVLTFESERQYSVYEKIFDIFLDTGIAYNFLRNAGNDWQNIMNNMFQANQGLFMWVRIRECESLRSMETPFGILPVPKYNEQQNRYYSSINPYTSTILGVPVSNTEMERTGIILEALAAESLYTVQPAYYDITLQTKVACDIESKKMLFIIYDNVCYDIGEILGLGNLNEYVYLVDQENRNIASYYEKNEAKALADIEKIMEIVLNVGNS